MVWLVLAPVLLGVAIYKLPRALARTLTFAGQVGLGWLAVSLWLRAHREGTFFDGLGGESDTLYVVLRGERTALALTALSTLLFAASFVYCLRAKYTDNKLLMLLLILQGLSAGIFLTDDVFNLFVLLEVASLAAVLLVMYRKGRRNTYDGLYYLMVQLVAMAFFLFGVAYLYRDFGVLNVTAITETIAAGGVDPRVLVLPLAMMFTGVGLKAGLFPLFSYLPRSYGNPGAPSVMLLLMSAVLVKGALFWVYRLGVMFMGDGAGLDVSTYLGVLGLLTGIGGAVMALAQSDVRLVLAYSTVSQAGLITLGFAAGTDTAVAGAELHMLTHALAKSVLFLTAAMVIRRYGTGKLDQIRGVGRRMPLTATLTVLAMLSLVGLPLTAGSVSKDLLSAGASGWISVAMWVVNFGTFLVMARCAVVLFGEPAERSLTVAWRPVPDQAVVVTVLSAIVVAIGAFGPQVTSLVTGFEASTSLWPTWAKVTQFLVLGVAALALALAARQWGKPVVERCRLPWTDTLTLPQATLALTVFFFATTLWATLATGGFR